MSSSARGYTRCSAHARAGTSRSTTSWHGLDQRTARFPSEPPASRARMHCARRWLGCTPPTAPPDGTAIGRISGIQHLARGRASSTPATPRRASFPERGGRDRDAAKDAAAATRRCFRSAERPFEPSLARGFTLAHARRCWARRTGRRPVTRRPQPRGPLRAGAYSPSRDASGNAQAPRTGAPCDRSRLGISALGPSVSLARGPGDEHSAIGTASVAACSRHFRHARGSDGSDMRTSPIPVRGNTPPSW
jgi:hypothetical protein